jgi:periplasmic nitrate reductase NapD
MRFETASGVGKAEQTTVNISSLVVHVKPEQARAVQAQWREWPGVEVHAAAPDGRLVVTIDVATDAEASATFDRIRAQPGVMSAALVYHQFEPDPPG